MRGKSEISSAFKLHSCSILLISLLFSCAVLSNSTLVLCPLQQQKSLSLRMESREEQFGSNLLDANLLFLLSSVASLVLMTPFELSLRLSSCHQSFACWLAVFLKLCFFCVSNQQTGEEKCRTPFQSFRRC